MVCRIEKSKHTKRLKSSAFVPYPIATPTDLITDQVKVVVTALNPMITNTVALYVKVKNFHWHLASSQYRDDSILFDEHAEQQKISSNLLDKRTPRINSHLGGRTGDVQQSTSIAEDHKECIPGSEMLECLLADHLHIIEQTGEADSIELTQEDLDQPSNLLIGLLEDKDTEKRISSLYESIRDEEMMK